MSMVDYAGIRDAIKALLDADSEIGGAGVYTQIEAELSFDFDKLTTGEIGIYMTGRDAPDDRQTASAGTENFYQVQISIWVSVGYLGELEESCRRRDRLINHVERVMMSNRELNGTVSTLKLAGGQFLSAQGDQTSSWIAAGETVLIADARATL